METKALTEFPDETKTPIISPSEESNLRPEFVQVYGKIGTMDLDLGRFSLQIRNMKENFERKLNLLEHIINEQKRQLRIITDRIYVLEKIIRTNVRNSTS